MSAAGASADPIADFYRGKTIRMLIGYGPGGGYDLYARLVAEFLPRHLPGSPTILPENMPGAGSFVAAKYMAAVAPKDGTVLGSLAQTLALDSAVGGPAKVNAENFHFIGRVTTNIDTGVALPSSGIKSFEDVRAKQYTVGASGGGSTTVLYPVALNAYGGAKFKIVRGYKGTTEILLAMERGEVDITGAYGLPGMLVSHPGWIGKGEASIIYQAALKASSAVAQCADAAGVRGERRRQGDPARHRRHRRDRPLHHRRARCAAGPARGFARERLRRCCKIPISSRPASSATSWSIPAPARRWTQSPGRHSSCRPTSAPGSARCSMGCNEVNAEQNPAPTTNLSFLKTGPSLPNSGH